MEIGQKIKKMRKEAGISQEEPAFALEVSRQTVTRRERGRMIPDTDLKNSTRAGAIPPEMLLRLDIFSRRSARKTNSTFQKKF